MTGVTTIRRPGPVTEYLRLQGRFAHLFDREGNPAQPDVLDALQAMADDNIRRYGLSTRSMRCRPDGASPSPSRSKWGRASPTRPAAGGPSARCTWTVSPPATTPAPPARTSSVGLYLAEDGSYESAWREILRVNPFPAVMGRACFHPCQTACNRATIDEAVGINAIERFLGDRALAEGWLPDSLPPPTGRRVLVVGSGPGRHDRRLPPPPTRS